MRVRCMYCLVKAVLQICVRCMYCLVKAVLHDVCALHVLSGEGCSSQYGLAKQAAESSEISHLHQCITRAL